MNFLPRVNFKYETSIVINITIPMFEASQIQIQTKFPQFSVQAVYAKVSSEILNLINFMLNLSGTASQTLHPPVSFPTPFFPKQTLPPYLEVESNTHPSN